MNNIEEIKAIINQQSYQREFVFQDVRVLGVEVNSFIADVPGNMQAAARINGKINNQINSFLRYNENETFPLAVDSKKSADAEGFPFNQFESILNYIVTYNSDGYLSSYRDNYTFTGGAHGTTVRKSDTFSLISGRSMPLQAFFPRNSDYQAIILKEILIQADELYKENPGIFFDNYQELIIKNFDSENYFLSDEGLNIYYQQYDIAPYSSGIIVFTIPYDSLK